MENENPNQDKSIPNPKESGKKSANVPNLRFNNEAWRKSSLGETCERFDYGLGAEAIQFDGKNKYIRITDINDETSFFDIDNCLSPSFVDSKCLVKKYDILLARTGASTGKSYIQLFNDDNLYFAGFLIRLSVKSNFNPLFIYQYTKTKKYENWVKIFSSRSGQPGINANEYKQFDVYFPTLSEQNKISSFLSKLDERINTQIKIIRGIESYIIGIKHHVFSLKSSSYQFITSKKIGDFLIEYTKKNSINNLIPVAVGKYGIRRRDEIYSKELSKDYSKNKVIEKNTLCIGMGSSQIDIGVLTDDIQYCVSPAYTTYNIHGIDTSYLDEYLSYLNKFLSKKYMIISARQGKCVNKIELLNQEIKIHSYEDQKRIIKKINSLKNKLKIEKNIFELYRKQKEYLLQNMFI